MPLLTPAKTIISEWAYHLDGGTATVTPGNNTFGTAVQLGGGNLAEEAWAIRLNIVSIAVSAASKDSLTQIGFDFSGGATFPASPNRYNSFTLLTSCAGAWGAGGSGVWYYFPLRVPAGTSVMARGSVNNATVGTQGVRLETFGQPKYPESVRRGSYVESLGIVTASSRGTLLTPGVGSEGTAVSLGTLDANHPCWYWEFGWGTADTTMTNAWYLIDLLAGSSSGKVILTDGLATSTSAEIINKGSALGYANINEVAGEIGRAHV